MVRVLKLRNIRIKEQKKLNENNLYLYKHIISYIKATDLTMYEKEEILHQIMDMLLEAQYENRDKSFIVGDDYKIKVNINFNNNSKLVSCLLGIFTLSLILQLASRHLFNIDPYTYVILLQVKISRFLENKYFIFSLLRNEQFS